jgi:hypothetical protein
MIRMVAFALMLTITVSSVSVKAADVSYDAYVWQRRWTPAVTRAITEQADLIQVWRILAGQSNRGAPLVTFNPDWDGLKATGRPTIAVIRIDGPQARWSEAGLIDEIMTTVETWRRHGISLIGLELDHDSATSRLPEYTRLVAATRARLGGSIRLSITALPTWLASPDLDGLMSQVDEVVLQVHGVDRAPLPIFQREKATEWVRRLATRTDKPFRVALPTYRARVSRDASGSVVAVEAEVPLMAGGVDSVELWTSPKEVDQMILSVTTTHPPNLAGFVWFRLPTDSDRMTWSPATLRAVIRRQNLEERVEAKVVEGAHNGLARIVLINAGKTDARLPHAVNLPARCAQADGINGYALDGTTLRRRTSGMLRDGRQLEIGWARCSLAAEEIDVAAN